MERYPFDAKHWEAVAQKAQARVKELEAERDQYNRCALALADSLEDSTERAADLQGRLERLQAVVVRVIDQWRDSVWNSKAAMNHLIDETSDLLTATAEQKPAEPAPAADPVRNAIREIGLVLAGHLENLGQAADAEGVEKALALLDGKGTP
jgi:hypothetical protein